MACSKNSPVCPEMRDQSRIWDDINIPKCCKENLLTLLVETADFFNNNNINYWIDYGTLLGFIRDGEIIPWDRDVDFSIFASDFGKLNEAFSEHGEFNFGSSTMRNAHGDNARIEFVDYSLDSGLVYMPSMGPDYFGNAATIPRVFFSFVNRLYADIYSYSGDETHYFLDELTTHKSAVIRQEDGKPRPEVKTLFHGLRRSPKKHFDKLESINIKGVDVKIPSDPEEYLAIRYGPNWKIPDPKFYKKYPPGTEKYKEMCDGNF